MFIDKAKLYFSLFLLAFLAVFLYMVSNTNIAELGEEQNKTWLQEVLFKLKKYAKENEFILATAWVGICGSLATSLLWIYSELSDTIYRNFVLSITLSNTNDSFDWLMEYLGKQYRLKFENPNKEPVLVSFVTSPTLQSISKKIQTNNDSWNDEKIDEYGDEQNTKISFIPGDGFHVFTFKGKLFWFDKSEAEEAVSTGFDENSHFKLQKCTLSMLGSINNMKNREILQDLFDCAIQAQLSSNSELTKVFVLHQWRGWSMAMAKRKRPIESLILDGDITQKLLNDAQVFLSKKKWYAEKGIPFRRGYLLYGVPGTGKSSFVTVLAGKLNLNICVMNLSNGNIDDQGLMARLHDAPPRSIILLEDIDAIFLDRNMPAEKEKRGKSRAVTFSGLLNALDGVHAAEDGRIIFLTTNHIEKLDPALLRAGRCDVKVEFKHASPLQLRRAFERFFPESTFEQVEQFMQDFEEESPACTMAQFTEFLCRFKGNLSKVITKGKEFAAELRQQQEYTLNATKSLVMPIEPWLARLGLAKFTQQFKTLKISTMEDIKDSCSSHFISNTLGIKMAAESDRLERMVKGDDEIMAVFQYAEPSDIKKLLMDTFPGVDESFITAFIQLIPKSKVSICQIACYLYSFKLRMLYEEQQNPMVILNEALDPANIEKHLFSPQRYHIEVPEHLRGYMHPKEAHNILNYEMQYETTEQWLNRLNNKYQWYDANEDPNPATIMAAEASKAPEEKKEVDKEDEGKTKKEDGEEPELPDTKANLLKRLMDNGLETTEALVSLSESDLKDKYNIKKKGRRLLMLQDLSNIKKEEEKLNKLQEKVEELYDL